MLPFYYCSHSKQFCADRLLLAQVDYTGRGELAERQQRLGQMMNRLRKVAEGALPPAWWAA